MAPAQSPGWRRLFRGQFRKTKMCHFHALGRCHYGEKCAFAHSSEDLECAPDLTKTALCIAWQKGHCPLKAADCHYAHGAQDLRLTPAFNKAKLSQRTRVSQHEDGVEFSECGRLEEDEMSNFALGCSVSTGEGSFSVSRESTATTTNDLPAPRSAAVATKRPTASPSNTQPWCNNPPISAPPGLELPVQRRTLHPAMLARPCSFRVESAACVASAAAAVAVAAAANAANLADAAVAATSTAPGQSMACVCPRQPPEWHSAWSGLATLTPKGTSTTPPMVAPVAPQTVTPVAPQRVPLPLQQHLTSSWSSQGMPRSPDRMPRSPVYVPVNQRLLQLDEGRQEIASVQP